jgi:hypothetical protein
MQIKGTDPFKFEIIKEIDFVSPRPVILKRYYSHDEIWYCKQCTYCKYSISIIMYIMYVYICLILYDSRTWLKHDDVSNTFWDNCSESTSDKDKKPWKRIYYQNIKKCLDSLEIIQTSKFHYSNLSYVAD